ncbi:midasin [Dorcoceras hygrometricum]|uniref:Midasin n=1 Tax=Dorcoceras hygrometricum TaxID=472368 RepID=A0A2Z7B4F0_9LAMI|nr:midasin [Dorcoceras hygrometricum]
MVVENKKKKQEKMKKVVEQPSVEAGSQAAPKKTKYGTRSDEDSCLLTWLKKGGVKRKQVIESSDSEATVTVPPVLITKKAPDKRAKKMSTTVDNQPDSQLDKIPEIPAGGEKGSTAGEQEATAATPPELEKQAGDGSNTHEQDEHKECRNEASNVDEQELDGVDSTIAQGKHDESPAGGSEGNVDTTLEYEERVDGAASNAGDQEESMECENQTEEEGQDGNNSFIVQGEHEGSIPEMEKGAGHQDETTVEGHMEIGGGCNIPKFGLLDGLEIKIDVLESTRKFVGSQENLAALENGLVCHFADSQQHSVDEVASLKSQVAGMVECLRELHQ